MSNQTGANSQHSETQGPLTNSMTTRSSEPLEAAKEKLSRAADQIEIAARDAMKELQDQFVRTLATSNAQIARAQGIITEQAQERPLISAATVFGVGVLTGAVVGLMIAGATRDVRARGR